MFIYVEMLADLITSSNLLVHSIIKFLYFDDIIKY